MISDKLLCEVDDEGKPIIVSMVSLMPLIELFEGSTYENVDNVGEDYIRGMLVHLHWLACVSGSYLVRWGALQWSYLPTVR